MDATQQQPPVVLFGYDSSPFTQKVRLALRLKQILYTYVVVPSMMPRPVLRDGFGVTYRKIPVLAIGREIYCDTSIILEALEYAFNDPRKYPSLYPIAADGRTYRPLIRGFASYWTDRPFFRVTTGLIPSSVWRTHFGTDRAELIGHKLDPEKLERKVPFNLTALDQQLSLLEPLFHNTSHTPWIFSTPHPSLADITLYYQLQWGTDIAAGRGIHNLTGGGTPDTDTAGATPVFNRERYPGLHGWSHTMQQYFDELPSTETKTSEFEEELKRQLRECKWRGVNRLMVPTPRLAHTELDARNGLVEGVEVAVAPDDTGRDDPTLGTLVALSPEEIVIKPARLEKPAAVECRVHFPRLGFVVRPVRSAKL